MEVAAGRHGTDASAEAVYLEYADDLSAQERETPQRYWGSVRFFKHVILGTIALMILVPTVLAASFAFQIRSLSSQVLRLQGELDTLLAAGGAGQDGTAPGGDTAGTELPAGPASEEPDYTKLYPELYSDAEEYATEDVEHSVYLTFDDGPSPRTDEILKILDRYGVKATFFVVGASGEEDLQRMRNIVAAGHTLAIHSYSHNYQKIYASVEAYLEDFYQMYTQIVEATGVKPQIFRFPGGSINAYNGGIYQEIIAEMTRRGFVYFDWNAANGDAVSSKILPAATLAENALKGVDSKRRAVILMHDSSSKTTTVEALPAIIEGYQKGGYTFAPLTAATKQVTFGYRY